MIDLLVIAFVAFLILGLDYRRSVQVRNLKVVIGGLLVKIDEVVAQENANIARRQQLAMAMRMFREAREDFQPNDRDQWDTVSERIAQASIDDAAVFFAAWGKVEARYSGAFKALADSDEPDKLL